MYEQKRQARDKRYNNSMSLYNEAAASYSTRINQTSTIAHEASKESRKLEMMERLIMEKLQKTYSKERELYKNNEGLKSIIRSPSQRSKGPVSITTGRNM